MASGEVSDEEAKKRANCVLATILLISFGLASQAFAPTDYKTDAEQQNEPEAKVQVVEEQKPVTDTSVVIKPKNP